MRSLAFFVSCGCLGHAEQHCQLVFSLENDDGVRAWGPYLRADNRRTVGGGSRWLREEGRSGPNGGNYENPRYQAISYENLKPQAQNQGEGVTGLNANKGKIVTDCNLILTTTNGINTASSSNLPLMGYQEKDMQLVDKKRRRFGINSDAGGIIGGGDFTVMMEEETIDNARVNHVLLVGPGEQARQGQ